VSHWELLMEALKSLIAAGPVAMVLGISCYVLWKENKALRKQILDIRETHDEQRKAYEEKNDRLQAKMLRLAMRVQRSIEAIANIPTTTEVEEFLDDEDDRNRL